MTYADAEWRNGFFQDKSGAIYVDLSEKNVQAGQIVEITGHTSPGGFAPEVLNSAIRILGRTNLPTPAKVDLEDLANGRPGCALGGDGGRGAPRGSAMGACQPQPDDAERPV